MLIRSTRAPQRLPRRLLVTAVVVAVLGVLVLPPARGQQAALVSPAVAAIATDVVDGRVIVVQSIDTGAAVHTLAMIDVDRSVKGALSGQVFVEVPGGRSADGAEIVVSHQPRLVVGAMAQFALIRATAEEEAALTGGLPVYSIVGGSRGIAGLDGSVPDQTDGDGCSTDGPAPTTFYSFLPGNPKWEAFPVPYVINPDGSGLSGADTIGAIQGALQQWVADPGSDVTFGYGGTTTAGSDNYVDELNTVSWLDTPSPADIYVAQTVYAQTDGVMYEFDLQVNRDHLFSLGAEPGRYDLETIMVHEFGHVLGLGHTDDPDTAMFFEGDTYCVKGLGAGDRAGVAALYPPGSAGGTAATCGGLVVTIDMNTNGGSGQGTAGPDVILGTPGNDVIDGDGGDDVICGDDGSDTIRGGDGADTVHGGNGSDTIESGAGDDVVYGEGGNDRIFGQDDDDRIDGGGGADLVLGGSGNDIIEGGEGADRLVGDDGQDTIRGGNGDDLLWGEAGADQLYGGPGNDYLIGKSGDDHLDAGPGADFINGGDGDDVMIGGDGLDRLWGFDGLDWLRGGDGDDRLFGMAGNDTIAGQGGDDIATGGSGDDTLSGGAGHDLLWGLEGADTLDGGPGDDTLIGGGAGPNSIRGGDGDDSIVGGTGTDRAWGGAGLDRLWGGDGDDVLYGEAGDDRLFGMQGFDGCHGGGGFDLAFDCETTSLVP